MLGVYLFNVAVNKLKFIFFQVNVFKAKGEAHQSSKTKNKVPVDIERVNDINKLVDSFLTESRLNQGIDFLIENHVLALSKPAFNF